MVKMFLAFAFPAGVNENPFFLPFFDCGFLFLCFCFWFSFNSEQVLFPCLLLSTISSINFKKNQLPNGVYAEIRIRKLETA